jgi:hypothetical protein
MMPGKCIAILFAFLLQEPPTVSASTYSISGIVLDQATLLPVSGMPIYATAATGRIVQATTDDSGNYILRGLSQGRYQMSTGGQSYHPTARMVAVEGVNVTGVEFRLARSASLSGTVLDQDGKPVPNVSVSVFSENYHRGRPMSLNFSKRRTNEQGAFEFGPLAAESFYLLAEPQLDIKPADSAPGAKPKDPVYANVRTYFPASPTREGATTIRLQAGEQRTGVRVVLLHEPTVCLSSVLKRPADATGPAALMLSELYPMSQSQIASGPTQPGPFEICGIGGGAYRLRAMLNDPGKGILYANQMVTISPKAAVRVLDVDLATPSRLHGIVRMREDPLISNSKAEVPAGLLISLVPKDRIRVVGEGLRAEVRPKSGEFRIPAVLPEPYWVSIEGLREPFYVVDVRYESREAYGSAFTPSSGTGNLLEVTLADDGPVITGTAEVKPGTPAVNATVLLTSNHMSHPPRPDEIISLRTNGEGAFAFSGIRPGEYRIDAYLPAMPSYRVENPNAVPVASSRTVRVRLGSRDRKHITLTAQELP